MHNARKLTLLRDYRGKCTWEMLIARWSDRLVELRAKCTAMTGRAGADDRRFDVRDAPPGK
jgi:hypothetical protein